MLRTCPRCGGKAVRTDEIRQGASCPNCLATVEVSVASVMVCNAVLLGANLVLLRSGFSLWFLPLAAHALFVLRQEWFTTRYFPLKAYER